MSILFKIVSLVWLTLPFFAVAHVKWFVEGENPIIPDENTAL